MRLSSLFRLSALAGLTLVTSLAIAAVVYSLGIWYGMTRKSLFYVAIFPFSLIMIVSCFIIKPVDDPIQVFLLVAVFIVVSTTILVRTLIQLNKTWHELN